MSTEPPSEVGSHRSRQAEDRAVASADPKPYVLRLYVTDATPRCARAIVNARRILEENLAGRYSLEIIDIATHVAQAATDQIVAAPTLLRLAPPPARRIIGDMSDVDLVLKGLDVRPPR